MRPRKRKARRALPPKAPKNKNRSTTKPVLTESMKAKWNPRLPTRINMARLGLAERANHVVQAGDVAAEAALAVYRRQPEVPAKEVLATLGVEAGVKVGLGEGDLRELSRNPKRKPMNEGDQSYCAALIEKHGDDYVAMRRDVDTNWRQWAEDRCRRLCTLFLGLGEQHRVVPVPAPRLRRRAAPI